MNREPDTCVHCGLITPAQLVERYTFGLPLFMRMSDKYDRTKGGCWNRDLWLRRHDPSPSRLENLSRTTHFHLMGAPFSPYGVPFSSHGAHPHIRISTLSTLYEHPLVLPQLMH